MLIITIIAPTQQTYITNTGAYEILKQYPNWRKSLKQAQAKYNLEPAFVMALIYQESRFDANAKKINIHQLTDKLRQSIALRNIFNNKSK